MKILVFEYISGGGLAGQALPPSLAAEGCMMLQALIDDLKSLPDIALTVPLDERCCALSLPANADVFVIAEHQDVISLMPELIAGCDAVWPIAPESDQQLANIAEMVVAQNKILLLSSPEAVLVCGDKLATYRALSAHQLPAVETRSLAGFLPADLTRSVIKPADGVGCIGGLIVEDEEAFRRVVATIAFPEAYVIQPFCEGLAVSLSCLFKQGKGWLICSNQQQIDIDDKRFILKGCLVNTANPLRDYYQDMVERIATAIPGLWGYVGVDLIETSDRGPLLLEINPRLTTSFVGIRRATGLNLAEQVLSLMAGEPAFQSNPSQSVNITIN